jgi:hypothetical protein
MRRLLCAAKTRGKYVAQAISRIHFQQVASICVSSALRTSTAQGTEHNPSLASLRRALQDFTLPTVRPIELPSAKRVPLVQPKIGTRVAVGRLLASAPGAQSARKGARSRQIAPRSPTRSALESSVLRRTRRCAESSSATLKPKARQGGAQGALWAGLQLDRRVTLVQRANPATRREFPCAGGIAL